MCLLYVTDQGMSPFILVEDSGVGSDWGKKIPGLSFENVEPELPLTHLSEAIELGW